MLYYFLRDQKRTQTISSFRQTAFISMFLLLSVSATSAAAYALTPLLRSPRVAASASRTQNFPFFLAQRFHQSQPDRFSRLQHPRRCTPSYKTPASRLDEHRYFSDLDAASTSGGSSVMATYTVEPDDEKSATPNSTKLFVEDETTWQSYKELMTEVMQNDRVIGAKKIRPDMDQIQKARRYLLTNCALAGLSPPPAASHSTVAPADDHHDDVGSKHCGSGKMSVSFRERIREHKKAFLLHTNFTENTFNYCERCLLYLANLSAKRQTPVPCLIAWYKLRECGIVPRQGVSDRRCRTVCCNWSLFLGDS